MHIPNSEIAKMSEKCEKYPETPPKPRVEPTSEPKSVELKDRHSSAKERHSPSKDNYYIKKRILAAIKRSFRSSNNSLQQHADGIVIDEEKNDLSKNCPAVTVIVKQIDLDKESILYTREKDVPDVIDLDTFKLKEVSSSRNNDSKHHNSNHLSSERKRASDDRNLHRSEKRPSNSATTTATSTITTNHHNQHHHSEKKKLDESAHRTSSKKHHISEETLKGPYLLCHSCGRKYDKKWVHPDCKNRCCRSTVIYCDSCLRHKIIKNDIHNKLLRGLSFGKYMYVVKCPSGRGCSLHLDYDRIMHLRSSEQKELAKEFLKQAFKEDDQGFAHFTIAIVHNGARFMPDILKLVAKTYPTLKVNTTKLKSSTETELSDLLTYYKKVKETYNCGTYSHDPLNETQAACVKNADEYGGYLPELLSLLERSPFLSPVLPWGEMTTKRFLTPHESDDGPIFWCRPGEQIISLDRNSQRNRWNSGEIEAFLKERKKNMNASEKKLIVEELKKYRRSNSVREFLFEDRTKPHADQAWGNSFEATAAVGVIQAIHPDEHPDYNRICKEIIVFQAKHLEILEALLHIDTTAAPKQQCAEWLDDAKLNMIRQMKIEFSKMHLRDNDIYFIPRKIVHQFRTVSATLSMAWHARLREYYDENMEKSLTITKPIAEDMPSNCIEQRTPKKKNRSRSTSLELREHEGSRSAKKRIHDSPRRSRSSCKKFKNESSSLKNCPTDMADVSTIATESKNNISVEAATVSDVEAKSEQSTDSIYSSEVATAVSIEQQQQQPSSDIDNVKTESKDENDRKIELSSNKSVQLLSPQVHIVDIRSHIKEEPVSSHNNILTHSIVNNSNTSVKRGDRSDGETEVATEIEATTNFIVDASQPSTETSSVML